MQNETQKLYFEIGKQLMKGALDCLLTWGLKVILIGIALLLLWNWFGWLPVDETDESKWNRSGVVLITDYGTGVQYLYKDGALTPRLDKNGQIIYKGKK